MLQHPTETPAREREDGQDGHHDVAAQVEFESNFDEFESKFVEFESRCLSGLSSFSFKSLIPGAFNVGLIGATCTGLPR